MIDKNVVADAAQRLSSRDETSLETLLGLRQRALERDPGLSDNVDFEPKYDSNTKGAMDDIKDLGRRILSPSVSTKDFGPRLPSLKRPLSIFTQLQEEY
jgi:hypothetical protein